MFEIDLLADSIRRTWFFTNDFYYFTTNIGAPKRGSMRSHVWHPPTDIFENESEVVVRVEIAGVSENDINITADGDQLVIHGYRSDTAERRVFRQMEIRFGEFLSEVELPAQIDISKAYATYQNGFLNVILPKDESNG